jgi:hypothetical protein
VKTGTDLSLVVLLVGLVPVLAQAAPTMLNQIPTPDLVPFHQLSLQLANGNTEVSGDASVWHQPQVEPQTQFGLPWRMEAGLDVVPSNPQQDYRPVLNLKWSPLEESYRIPAGAVGITQVGPNFTPDYYVVLSKTLNYDQIAYQKFRAHHRNIKLRGIRLVAGAQVNSRDAWNALVGTDIEVNDHFIVQADWISGARNSVSLGGVLVINQHDSVQAALLRGNDQDRLSGVILQLNHTFDVLSPLEW